MAASKPLQLIFCLAILLLLSLFRGSDGCWAEESYNKSQHHVQFHKVSRYSFFSENPKWPPSKYSLTYTFLQGFPSDKMAPIAEAFEEWASKTHFRFSQVPNTGPSDIKISFQRGSHGDGYPFDGRGGTLAHAFAPQDGRLHLDGDDPYVVGAVPGSFDTQTVTIHEIGHLLGLGHSTVYEAVMYPTIRSGATKTTLHPDDINGIKALYGV